MLDLNDRHWEIIERIDTRTWYWDGKWVVDPGSGEPIPCQQCGRLIEIWVYIRHNQTGERAIVGTECAKAFPLHNKTVLGNNYTKRKHRIA